MGSFLILLGTLGILASFVMLIVRLVAKKGLTFKQIAVLAIIAIILDIAGGALSPPIQEGYKQGQTQKPVTKVSKTEQKPPVEKNNNNSPSQQTSNNSSKENNISSTAPVKAETNNSINIEKITIDKSNAEINKSNAENESQKDPAVETLEQAAKDYLGSRLKYVVVNSLLDDQKKKNVEIHFRGSDNLTTKYIRLGMLKDSAEVFQKIFTSNIPIEEAVTFVYFPLKDKYGNTSEEVVMKVYLKGETAKKINWDGVDKLHFDQVADDIWIIPALREE
ncbi:hypothetical protein D2962_08405 [Biomaibacter acetigenes]|uniref:Uncharacterized protein n=1 Tax=Biomaibacter acetigenes TaxID=2316383 RepID=A0A3G2R536_9FIRM|nr:hypothetical protein [Biomaibacter acetigenes]AYO30644.1 hypothetical protein D2962_08405 [Biomaibacter acetigenes]